MTVCIGVLAEQRKSVVLVADRMITTGLLIEFEHPTKNKITELSNNCLALTSGDALSFTELFTAVRGATSNKKFTSVEEIVEVIKQFYQQLRKKRVVEQTLLPRGFGSFEDFYQQNNYLPESMFFSIQAEIARFDYHLNIIVGGITHDHGHLYEIRDPGTSLLHDSIGFLATGAGFNLATSSLIASGCHENMSLSDALICAVKAKVMSENAPGVGRKTDISVILPEFGVMDFNDDDIKAIRVMCEDWKRGKNSHQSEIMAMVDKKVAEAKQAGLPNQLQDATMRPSQKEQKNGKSRKRRTKKKN